MDMKAKLQSLTQEKYSKSIADCDNRQLYYSLLALTNDVQSHLPAPQGQRKLYYISAEFLIGKLLVSNLLNLGLYEDVKSLLAAEGHSLTAVEEYEPEPSLGNGGLGRLAACFLDSIASLGLKGDGVGLNYHYGLFRQHFEKNRQMEAPNSWMEEESWLLPTDTTFTVPFGDFSVDAKLLEIAIPGYQNGIQNKLRLFDIAKSAQMPKKGIDFDKLDVQHNLTLFLYPDDSDEAGRILRVYQQYFMVSAAAQLILKELEEGGHSPRELCQYVAIQINDTHPSMIIPEMTRLLLERGLSMDEALHQVAHSCAYTNHTILSEALEKWPIHYLETVCPQIVPIIWELHNRAHAVFPDSITDIIDGDRRVHMAHMDIHYGHSVNGVAALHTDILKESELSHFYQIYPEKFNNKTNGITMRRWLMAANPDLSALIDDCIGTDWRTDASQLEHLLDYRHHDNVLRRLLNIKTANKQALVDALHDKVGVEIDPNSIFDIQIKRLHEYKRQQMNVLYVIHKYLDIKNGKIPTRPVTVIFGGKAAPAYRMAKNIIHLILCLQQLIEEDPLVRQHLRVVMIENYNVSWAEKLIPACDVSEQISLASKEASGTGNMKFMANGAITLGTMDGANVEIAQLVGNENIFTFGASSDEIIALYANGNYNPIYCYHDSDIERLVDFIVSPTVMALGDGVLLSELYQDMKRKDWFMALLDAKSYILAKERTFAAYEDRMDWAQKMLVNIAKSGFFSSDRTIAQYNSDIWKL